MTGLCLIITKFEFAVQIQPIACENKFDQYDHLMYLVTNHMMVI